MAAGFQTPAFQRNFQMLVVIPPPTIGGFQTSAFQRNYQTVPTTVNPGPSLITFLPASTKTQAVALSSYYATIQYLDIYGAAYVPLSVSWRVWDATNLVQLQNWTAITTPTQNDFISIPAAYNALGNAKNLVETREIIFLITAPGGAQRYDAGVYSVIAIPDIP
jgi:hypothetical protein